MPSIVIPRKREHGDGREATYLSPFGGFGQYLRRSGTFPDYGAPLSTDESGEIIRQIFAALSVGGQVSAGARSSKDDDVAG
ncbi:MAG: hypothetical protein R3A46_12635 [Thermomicrobiales bacterium]